VTAGAAVDYAAPEAYAGPRCGGCGGPCWQYKGGVWGYTCTACIERHLDAAAAKAAARDRKARERSLVKLLANNDFSPVSGRASGR